MYSYNEIISNIGKEQLPNEIEIALQDFYTSKNATSRLDALIKIHELTRDLNVRDKKTQSVINYLKSESENFVRGMLDANQVSDFEFKNLIEQRKHMRESDPEYLPIVKPQMYVAPMFGEKKEIFLDRERKEVESKTDAEVFRALNEHYETEKDVGYVKYLKTPEERDQFRVFMSDGNMFSINSMNVGEEDNWKDKRVSFDLYDSPDLNHIHPSSRFMYEVIFVLDPRGNMYVNMGTQGEFHHSSFLAGGPVIYAGEIEIRNGKLLHLNNSSGHYQPTETNMSSALKYLNSRQQIHDETKIEILAERNEFNGEILNHNEIEALSVVNKISAKDPLFDLIVLRESMMVSLAKLQNEINRIQTKNVGNDPRISHLESSRDNLLKRLENLNKDVNGLKGMHVDKEKAIDLNINHYNLYSKELSVLNQKLNTLPHPSRIKRYLVAAQTWAISRTAGFLNVKIMTTKNKTTNLIKDLLRSNEEGIKTYQSSTKANTASSQVKASQSLPTNETNLDSWLHRMPKLPDIPVSTKPEEANKTFLIRDVFHGNKNESTKKSKTVDLQEDTHKKLKK